MVVDEARFVLLLVLNLCCLVFLTIALCRRSSEDESTIRRLFKQLDDLSSKLDSLYDEVEITRSDIKDTNTYILRLVTAQSSTVEATDNSHKEQPSIDYHDGEGVLW